MNELHHKTLQRVSAGTGCHVECVRSDNGWRASWRCLEPGCTFAGLTIANSKAEGEAFAQQRANEHRRERHS